MVLFFYPMTQKFPDCSKFPTCSEIYGVCLKISRLVQILGVRPEISSMCPEILITQKDYICFLLYDPK